MSPLSAVRRRGFALRSGITGSAFYPARGERGRDGLSEDANEHHDALKPARFQGVVCFPAGGYRNWPQAVDLGATASVDEAALLRRAKQTRPSGARAASSTGPSCGTAATLCEDSHDRRHEGRSHREQINHVRELIEQPGARKPSSAPSGPWWPPRRETRRARQALELGEGSKKWSQFWHRTRWPAPR
jgi:hypothetical protein